MSCIRTVMFKYLIEPMVKNSNNLQRIQRVYDLNRRISEKRSIIHNIPIKSENNGYNMFTF